MSDVYANYNQILQKVIKAAKKSGENADSITIIGVTKNVDITKINSFLELGKTEVAENKVQELLQKHEVIGDRANWHLIGHLQTNKVKYIVDKVKLIQSVDSFRLAEEIDKCANKIGRKVNILVEINIAGEDSKFGIAPSECKDFIAGLLKFDGITVKGLMTVAPFVETPEDNRVYFKNMKNLFVDIQKHFNNNISMEYLSMGMTNDFETAIEEGSNMIRIGTGIFGARNN